MTLCDFNCIFIFAVKFFYDYRILKYQKVYDFIEFSLITTQSFMPIKFICIFLLFGSDMVSLDIVFYFAGLLCCYKVIDV